MAQSLWYLRHEGKIVGPYPPPQVEELLRAGDISGEWEISLDEQNWMVLKDSGQFSLSEATGGEEPAARKMAWVEERQRARERWRGESEDEPVPRDARIDESRRQALGLDQQHTERLVSAEHARRPSRLIGLLALLALAAVGVAVWWGQSEKPIQAALNQAVNCAAPAAEGVNWNNCDKRGAVLAGAPLRNARLDRARLEDARLAGAVMEYASAVGANLRNTDLRGAKLTAVDLSGADLSGADLSGANLRYAVIKDTHLAGTRMDHVVWSDGRTCAVGSVGECL
ncbi:MAG: pentapeptide repeat-containing protein [Gallionellaceae bacterium]|nr:pentapeptide repeat-containing protein [Gallionellaceae bacterium]